VVIELAEDLAPGEHPAGLDGEDQEAILAVFVDEQPASGGG
jgi:hypothetical protein